MSNSDISELIQISVPTKTISLEVNELEKLEIVLRPFKQRNFAVAIAIINKYLAQYNQVNQDYLAARKVITDNFSKQQIEAENENLELQQEKIKTIELAKLQAIAILDASFDEGMQIAKAIMSAGEQVAEDIKTIILMSIHKSTLIIEIENGSERNKIEADIDNLTWGECAVLLGSVVGLNMDFFKQNSQAMNLKEVLSEGEAKLKQKQKDGEESSADSSQLTTATAK